MPNDLIFVASASFMAYYRSLALYNVQTNRWTLLEEGLYNRRGASLITLGQRVFFIGGEEAEVIEEFDYNTNTW